MSHAIQPPTFPPSDSPTSLHHLFDQTRDEMVKLLERLRQEAETLREASAALPRVDPTQETAKLQQLREEMAENERVKDQFVALVAHDLKSPLAGQMVLLELLLKDRTHPLSPHQHELLQHAIAGSREMIRMVTSLLELHRLRSGKLSLQPTFFNARRLGEKIGRRLNAITTSKGITLLNELPVQGRLYGDPDLLGEVLHNLLTNAIKFSRSGGIIHLTWEESPPAGQVGIKVRDHGVGIPPELLPLLFRVEEKTTLPGTAGESGSGFGLPYSQELMRAHHGEIQIASDYGHGATATMRLPAVKPKVLVVDDLRSARALFSGYLQTLDTQILEAADGWQALALAQSEQPHLILSDIIMPELDGFELLDRLKQNPATSAIPVVMVTTDQQIETRDRAFQQGAMDFVVKPVVLCDFVPRIRNIIG